MCRLDMLYKDYACYDYASNHLYFFASNCYSPPNSIAGKIISGIKNDAGMGLLA